MSVIERYCGHIREKGYSEATVKSAWYILTAYKGYIGDNFNKRIEKATEEEIECYYKYSVERLKRRTVVAKVNTIRGFYKYAYREGLVLSDPTEPIEFFTRIDRVPKHVPDENSVKCLLNQPDGHTYTGIRDKAILELFYSTGIRRKELMSILVSDIDLKKRELRVTRGKGGKGRTVPAGKEAVKWITRYLEITRPKYLRKLEEDHLFITERGEALKEHTLYEMMKRYRGRSRLLKEITPHSLRHACALHMLRGGANIKIVQQMLGHKRISSTQVYTRLYPKDLKKMHESCHPRERGQHRK